MFSYQFHIRDYLTKTRHLTLLEDLAYRRLIDTYYTEESPLPTDIQACARLIAMRDHTDAVEAVLREFFLLTDAGWTNTRCDGEIAKYRSHQERGRHAAASRWINPKQPDKSMGDQSIDAAQMPTSNQKPVTKKPRKPTASGVRYDFERMVFVGTEDMIPIWEEAHPGVDIRQELAQARAWAAQNPDKAAGVQRWGQFLGNWFRKTRMATSVPASQSAASTSAVFEGLA